MMKKKSRKSSAGKSKLSAFAAGWERIFGGRRRCVVENPEDEDGADQWYLSQIEPYEPLLDGESRKDE